MTDHAMMDTLYARDADCGHCKTQGKWDYKSGSGPHPVSGKAGVLADDRCDSGIGSMNEKDEEMLREIQQLSLTDTRPGTADTAPCWRDFVSEDGDTFLHLAIIHGATDIVEQILRNTMEGEQYLNSQNYLKQTPLHLAVITEQPAVVQQLLWTRGDLGLRDVKGNTPLHIACEMNSFCVKTISECSTRLHIQSLLDNRNYNGLSCLHLAVKNRHHELVKYLIQLGANINAQEASSGRTALHLAVEEQDAVMVSLLLGCRADPNAQMYNGCTAFHLTMGRDNQTIQMELMKITDPSLLSMNEEDYLWEPESPERELTFSYDDCVIGGHLLSC